MAASVNLLSAICEQYYTHFLQRHIHCISSSFPEYYSDIFYCYQIVIIFHSYSAHIPLTFHSRNTGGDSTLLSFSPLLRATRGQICMICDQAAITHSRHYVKFTIPLVFRIIAVVSLFKIFSWTFAGNFNIALLT